jgi:diacylglycerol kinase (ATP)
MTQRLRLIANPTAGGSAVRKIHQAVDYLQGQGCQVELLLTTARGDARRFAAASRPQETTRVLVAGGDGTINEVINGLAPSSIPLAILPFGTTNVFALEAGIPFDVAGACRVAVHGTAQPVCLGKAGDHLFLQVAGAGFDANVVFGMRPWLKRRTGKLAYVLSGLEQLWRPARPLEVLLEDGSRHTAYSVILCKGRLYAGRFVLTPRALCFDNSLEVMLLLRPGMLPMLSLVGRVLRKQNLLPPATEIIRAQSLRISGSGPVQADGDVIGSLPMDFSTVAGALSIVFPPPASRCR